MFYELTFIARQDLSSSDVDNITESFSTILTDLGGQVVKNEYWGIRTLAYPIHNSKKGHYVMLGIEASADALKELEREMTLNEDIMRFLTIKVDEISKDPSPVLKAQSSDVESVDVTASKKESA